MFRVGVDSSFLVLWILNLHIFNANKIQTPQFCVFFGCVLHIEIGFQQGRVVEIFGPEASGKTTLALHVIAEAQKQGGYFLNTYKIYFNSYGSSS